MNQIPQEELAILKMAYQAIDDKFGTDIKVLNLKDISVLADYFIIATGNNANQVKAIAEEVDRQLYGMGVHLRHSEGMQTANWVLQDYGNLIVHIFDKENRGFYDIERVWADAPPVVLA